MRWRDPNLTEVIGFLDNPNNVIKANAAAYLQHLCYMDDPNKQKTRSLGGIPPLVMLLSHENPDVYRNACGALRYIFFSVCVCACVQCHYAILDYCSSELLNVNTLYEHTSKLCNRS